MNTNNNMKLSKLIIILVFIALVIASIIATVIYVQNISLSHERELKELDFKQDKELEQYKQDRLDSRDRNQELNRLLGR